MKEEHTTKLGSLNMNVGCGGGGGGGGGSSVTGATSDAVTGGCAAEGCAAGSAVGCAAAVTTVPFVMDAAFSSPDTAGADAVSFTSTDSALWEMK